MFDLFKGQPLGRELNYFQTICFSTTDMTGSRSVCPILAFLSAAHYFFHCFYLFFLNFKKIYFWLLVLIFQAFYNTTRSAISSLIALRVTSRMSDRFELCWCQTSFSHLAVCSSAAAAAALFLANVASGRTVNTRADVFLVAWIPLGHCTYLICSHDSLFHMQTHLWPD